MLPVTSTLLGSLSPPLPLELLRLILAALEPESVLALAATSRGGLWLVDHGAGAGLWKAWAERCLPPPASPGLALLKQQAAGAAAGTVPSLLLDPAAAGVPTSRPAFAALFRLRARAIHAALAPLLSDDDDDNDEDGEKVATARVDSPQRGPRLVSEYCRAHDALVALRAQGEAADAVLARAVAGLGGGDDDGDDEEEEGDAMMDVVGGPARGTKLGAARKEGRCLAPVALLLALHILHRLVTLQEQSGSPALDGWRRWALGRLVGGPFVGMGAVAYWTMGSHSPIGFRARDVLRTEKVDLRSLALAVLQRASSAQAQAQAQAVSIGGSSKATAAAAAAVAAIPTTEGGGGGGGSDPGSRLLARLESLRGIMPVGVLDPPVVFVEAAPEALLLEGGASSAWGGGGFGGGSSGAGCLVVNAQGHYELSSSPPRR